MRDPSTLAPIAQRVLSGDLGGSASAAERLLCIAGSFGAHALYSARVRTVDAESRNRFIRVLRLVGPSALPILKSGLERLADRLATTNAVEIAEDLLLALGPSGADSSATPIVEDGEELGGLVAAYARAKIPTLARAAVAALPSLWRERAQPIVLGLLEHPTPEVVVSALASLVRLGIADEHTPRRLARIAADSSLTRAPRLAATRALAHVRGDGRPVARELVIELLEHLKSPRTTDELELALLIARTVFVLHERQVAERIVTDATRAWPLETQARAIPPVPPTIS